MAALAALGNIAGMLKVSDAEPPNEHTTHGAKTLHLFYCVARHIMDNFNTIDMEPLILLNVTCEHLEIGLQPRLGDIDLADVEDEGGERILQALGACAVQCQLLSIAKVCRRLGNADENVRNAARDAVCEIVVEDRRIEQAAEVNSMEAGTGVVATLIQRTQKGKPEERAAALSRLQECAERGQQHVIDAVTSCLDHADVGVRCEAVKAFGQVARKGDKDAVAIILQRAKDRDHFVRVAALEGLGLLADRGDSDIFVAIASFIEDRNTVRRVAVRLLKQLADPGDAQLVPVLQEQLSHDDPAVRCASLKLLGSLADPSDEATEKLMEECLDSEEEEEVQEIANQALEELEERGKKHEKEGLATAGAIRSACDAAGAGP